MKSGGFRIVGSDGVRAGMPLADAALVVCRQRFVTMLAHEAQTRAGEDPEALHQMRVAARRLDAALRLFAECLPKWVAESRDAVRTLGRALGKARDFDVQLGHLTGLASRMTAAEQAQLAPLQNYLQEQRRAARAEMLRVLDSPRTSRWIRKWMKELHLAHQGARRASSESTPSFALAALRRRHKRLRRAAEALTPESSPEQYHDVRTRVKRLRYALEAFLPLYAEEGTRYLRALERLQSILGEYQDTHVRGAELSSLAASRTVQLPGETLFLMGRLAERDIRLARKLRARVPKAYRRACGRRWKALRRAMLAIGKKSAPAARVPSQESLARSVRAS